MAGDHRAGSRRDDRRTDRKRRRILEIRKGEIGVEREWSVKSEVI